MFNPIQYGIDRIIREIPRELLIRAFTNHPIYGYGNSNSIEDNIKVCVIDAIVRADSNMLGGQQVMIPLHDINYINIDAGYLFTIPLSKTLGRHIISVMGIETGAGIGSVGGIPHSPASTGTSRIELTGPNTLLVREMVSFGNAYLKCVIEDDAQMGNYSPRVMDEFGKLCVFAAQMYVYNALNIAMGDGSAAGGTSNSYLRGALDNFSDAATLYNEQLTLWAKISRMQDPETRREHISMFML